MNEQKIKELVLATGVVEYDWRGYMKYNSSEDLVEKLIEVVVRECAKFLDENSGSDCANNVWHPEPEDLLKHFGVEE